MLDDMGHQRMWFAVLLVVTAGCYGNRLASSKLQTSQSADSAPTVGPLPTPALAPIIADISGLPNGPLAAFVQQVWGPTVSQDCLACHVAHGYAPSNGAGFILQPPSQSDYLNTNLQAFSAFAQRTVNGNSYLLQKITNAIPHGGGQRMLPNDVRYQLVASWLSTPATASDLMLTDDKLQKLDMLDAPATLRRAAMQLAQRLPTPQEITLAQQGNLDMALDSVLDSDGFLTFVWNVYNKLFSYSNGLAGNNVASDRMDEHFFSLAERYWWQATDNLHGERDNSEASIAYQAENLAKYITANNRPFTEMVTANYFMANPFGAHVYGVFEKITWTDPNDATEYRAIPASVVQTATGQAFPMSGVLTLESFMNTYPTTASNRDRKRARYVYSMFLNTDIMGLAQNPPNLAKIIASSNPNAPAYMTNTACVSCHSLLDQVAGDYANYDTYGTFDADPNGIYGPVVMTTAGFEGTPVSSSATTRLAWLGQQIAADPRFADAIVSQWVLALTGSAPLRDPALGTSLQENIAAKIYQEQILHAIASNFIASNYNLKTVVKGLIESPYYRTIGASAEGSASASDAAMLDSFVGYHWRGSADLSSGLQAGFGTPWVTDRAFSDTLLQEYPSLMAGADTTGFSARITTIMGSNMACFAFYSSRYGYYSGASWMLPEPILTAEDPNSVTGSQDLQQAINTLVAKGVPLDSVTLATEQAAAWSLYQLVYDTALASPSDTPQGCIGGRLPANVLATDEAWMAVLTYVLTDPELLFE